MKTEKRYAAEVVGRGYFNDVLVQPGETLQVTDREFSDQWMAWSDPEAAAKREAEREAKKAAKKKADKKTADKEETGEAKQETAAPQKAPKKKADKKKAPRASDKKVTG